MSKVSTARLIAFDSFVEVMEKFKKPDEALEYHYRSFGEKKPAELKRIDKNLAKEILYGGLRWYKKIFWILQHTASRDLSKLSPEVRAALVLGTYQIFYMDKIPERAAVNESVEYIKLKKQLGAVGFVNGILRQIARRAEYFTKPDKKKQPVEYLALQFSHPEWLVSRWLDRFGFEKMEVMLASNNTQPPLFVRMNTLKTAMNLSQDFQDSLLKEEHIQSEKTSLRGCFQLKKFPSMAQDSLFAQGVYTIQDMASQLIPLLLGDVKGLTVLDAAAGPGGKLSHIAELQNKQGSLIAVEKDAGQMQKAKDSAARLVPLESIEWIEADFCDVNPARPVDKVLLDAPCTGLGVLRRHPEGKWHKTLSGMKEIKDQQHKMIEHGLKILKPDGELVYSVCSFEEEESTEHLQWLKKEFKDTIEVISPVGRLPDYFKRYVTRDNIFMVYAGNQDDMDGFAAFIIKKKS